MLFKLVVNTGGLIFIRLANLNCLFSDGTTTVTFIVTITVEQI